MKRRTEVQKSEFQGSTIQDYDCVSQCSKFRFEMSIELQYHVFSLSICLEEELQIVSKICFNMFQSRSVQKAIGLSR